MKTGVDKSKLFKNRDSNWLIVIIFIALCVILSQSFVQGGLVYGERVVDYALIFFNIMMCPLKVFGGIVYRKSPHGSIIHLLLMVTNVLSCLYFDVFKLALMALIQMGRDAILGATEYWYLGFAVLSCCQTVVSLIVAFSKQAKMGAEEPLIQNV